MIKASSVTEDGKEQVQTRDRTVSIWKHLLLRERGNTAKFRKNTMLAEEFMASTGVL